MLSYLCIKCITVRSLPENKLSRWKERERERERANIERFREPERERAINTIMKC